MLVHFRTKENFIFRNHAKPKFIVCDFGKVLINACLFEFSSETSTEYLDRIHKNLVEYEEISLRKKYSELFWSLFSHFRTEYGEIGVSLSIQSKCGKIRTRTTLNMDTIYAVHAPKKQ